LSEPGDAILGEMTTTIGWALVVAGFALALVLALVWQERLARRACDTIAVLAGVTAGAGGLVVVGGANIWSWIVAPAGLGLGAFAQRRALFAPGGPFRT
jgi:hypothetical protein